MPSSQDLHASAHGESKLLPAPSILDFLHVRCMTVAGREPEQFLHDPYGEKAMDQGFAWRLGVSLQDLLVVEERKHLHNIISSKFRTTGLILKMDP